MNSNMGGSKIILLDDPHLLIAGQRFALPAGRPSMLLAYLAGREDKLGWVTRNDLAKLFGIKDIRSTLFRAERQLLRLGEFESIEERHGNGQLRWAIQSDVEDFRIAVRERRWVEAAKIYKRDFLYGSEKDLGSLTELLLLQQSLRKTWVGVRSRAVEDLRIQRRFDEGAEILRQLLELSRHEDLDEALVKDAIVFAGFAAEPELAQAWFEAHAVQLEEIDASPSQTILQALQEANKGSQSAIASIKPNNQNNVTSTEPILRQQNFVGRGSEIEHALAALSRTNCRLLSLVGPGGVGKTSLARWLARECQISKRYRDGVVFVSLRQIASIADGIQAISDAAGLTLWGAVSAEVELLNALSNKEMLLLLDNFEDAMMLREFLSRLLTECEGVQCLVTSRERLEQVYPPLLAGLEHSFELPGLEQEQGMELLRRRAAERFSKTEIDAAAYARFHDAVGGMPLIIELAAAMMEEQNVQPQMLLDSLSQNLETLNVKETMSERHPARLVFEQSLNTLSQADQQRYLRLAIFPATFDQDAASVVTRISFATMNLFTRKSLVMRLDDGRLALHPVLRHYAWSLLTETEELAALHAQHYLRSVGAAAPHFELQLYSWVKELPNLRLVWKWLNKNEKTELLPAEILAQAQLAFALGALDESEEFSRYLCNKMHAPAEVLGQAWLLLARMLRRQDVNMADECLERAQIMAETSEQNSLEAEVLTEQGLNMLNRNLPKAHALFVRAKKLYEETERPDKMGVVLRSLARSDAEMGNLLEAQHSLEHSVQLLRQARLPLELAKSLTNLGVVLRQRKNLLQAKNCVAESMEIYQSIGESQTLHFIALNLGILGRISEDMGDDLTALDYLEQAKKIFSSRRDKQNLAAAYHQLAVVQGRLGRWRESLPNLSEALLLFMTVGNVQSQIQSLIAIANALRHHGTLQGLEWSLGLLNFVMQKLDLAAPLRAMGESVGQALQDSNAQPFAWGESMNEVTTKVLATLSQINGASST